MIDRVNSQALIIARESRGKSQAEMAEATGVSQGHISKAENDVYNLDPKQVEKIASYLQYPTSFFYESGYLREGVSNCLYHRKRKTLPAKVLNRVNAMMLVRNVNVHRILHGVEISAPRQFHTLDLEDFGGSAAKAARALRNAWRLPDGPVVNMVDLVESAGGVVVLAPFGHRKLFGMSCWTPAGVNPLFYLNSEIPMADLRFTIAHELGHLTLHGVPSSGDIEAEADDFAAELLMPSASAMADLKALTIDKAIRLKMHWKVPIKMIIRRAKELGAVTHEHGIRLYKQYSARGFNAAEPYPVPMEIPTLLARVIRVHLDDHNYTYKELLEAMRLVNAEDYQEVGGMPPGKGTLSVVRS
jgi:Zn-dependent peptidase ImmA (M78 family)/transcriptional regulator with XRE-family HTH domain